VTGGIDANDLVITSEIVGFGPPAAAGLGKSVHQYDAGSGPFLIGVQLHGMDAGTRHVVG
jgi:hypothetical protein